MFLILRAFLQYIEKYQYRMLVDISTSIDGGRCTVGKSHTPQDIQGTEHVMAKLSVLDRFLPLWIMGAMALGLVLGRFVPQLSVALGAIQIAHVSLPIALGLLVIDVPGSCQDSLHRNRGSALR